MIIMVFESSQVIHLTRVQNKPSKVEIKRRCSESIDADYKTEIVNEDDHNLPIFCFDEL